MAETNISDGKRHSCKVVLEFVAHIATMVGFALTTIFSFKGYSNISEYIKNENLKNANAEINIQYLPGSYSFANSVREYLTNNGRNVSIFNENTNSPRHSWSNSIRYFNDGDKDLAQSVLMQLNKYIKCNNSKYHFYTVNFRENRKQTTVKDFEKDTQQNYVYTIRDGYMEIWIHLPDR